MWTSARDLSHYVQLELAQGQLANGKRLVSAENLLARRVPQVSTGEDSAYGMGLFVDNYWGIPIVSHDGSLPGCKSDMFWLPDHGVGAVIFTNSDSGALLPFLRRLLEVLFEAKPEAEDQLHLSVARRKADQITNRKRLAIPPDTDATGKLAARYPSAELGKLAILRRENALFF